MQEKTEKYLASQMDRYEVSGAHNGDSAERLAWTLL